MPVHRSLRDGVLVLELDNPPVNAMSPDVLSALLAAIDEGEADTTVCAFVLAGRNGIFTGGADIRWFRLSLASWYGFALPHIDVGYDVQTHELREYRGLSNIRDAAGHNLFGNETL